MSLKVSGVSRTAALLIIVLGIFTLVVGLASAVLEDTVAGVAFVVLGVILYSLLFRFTRKVERELDGEETG